MKTFIRWFGYAALAIVVLVLIAVGYFYWKSNSVINRSHAAADVALDLPPADSTALARGRHLALTLGCTDCHGPDLGGTPFMDAMPVAMIPAPNLTPAGVGSRYTDADWMRAIRHGVGPDGRSLWIMPSAAYTHLSPADLSSLIAFLKETPAVERDLPLKTFGPVGRMLVANGSLKPSAAEVDHDMAFRAAPTAGPTAEYGAYLVNVCSYCHGAQLDGGLVTGDPDSPPSSNLTPSAEGIGHYSEEDFFAALREGRKPDGTVMNTQYMPWQATAAMTDDEIRAIWAYVQTLEPLPTGRD